MTEFGKAIVRIAHVVLAAALVAGCAGRGAQTTVPQKRAEAVTGMLDAAGFRTLSMSLGPHVPRKRHHRKFAGLLPGAPPQKIDPKHVPANLVRRITTVSSLGNARAEAAFAAMRRAPVSGPGARTAQNVLYDSDHGGQFGLYSYQGAYFASGTYGYQTGYETVETAYAFPSGDYLFAPTNRGVGGSCLEIGTSYSWLAAQVYAYDFCDPGSTIGVFHYLFTIDGSFRSSYERDYGDGLPSYAYETYYNWGNGKWDALLYNASTGQWEVRYESQTGTLNPQAQGANGWNMFETHYLNTNAQGVACPLALEVHSQNAQWINPSGGWQYLDSVPGITYGYRAYDQYNQCLDDDDGSGRGYYYLLAGVSDHEWYVESEPSEDPCAIHNCGGDPYPYYPPYYYYGPYGCDGGFTTGRSPCPLDRKRRTASSQRSPESAQGRRRGV